MPKPTPDQAPSFAQYLTIRSAVNPVANQTGNRIAFLTDITGTFQVWSLGIGDDAEGGAGAAWPHQLTFFEDKIWELHAAPQEDRLIAVGDVGGNECQQFYLIDNFGYDKSGLARHSVTLLTTDDRAIHRFGIWRGSGDEILYTANGRNHVDFDLYAANLSTGEEQLVAELSGNCFVVACSPDGATALVLEAASSNRNDLILVRLGSTAGQDDDDPDEPGQMRRLTDSLPEARYPKLKWTEQGLFTLTDRGHDRSAFCRLDPATGALETIVTADALLAQLNATEGELESFALSHDGRLAALVLNVAGYSRLVLVSTDDGTVRPMSALDKGVIANVSFTQDDAFLLLDYQAPRQNPNVWRLAIASGKAQQLTFSNCAGLDTAAFVTPDLIHYETFDGRSIPAYLYRPATPQPEDGYPCILYVHGGPAGQQRPDFDVRFQYFLRCGYALLVPNVRGSTGYGREYMTLDDVELRMDSVADLEAAVTWLTAQPHFAADRIAIYGRSYGGFMVLAAMTEYPELFAAGIDVVGIADWVTFLERTSAWRRAHREAEYGSLDAHRDLLHSLSPIHRAERIAAPLLVIAGDNDPRVPLYESEQIVDRVRAGGGRVDFIHYADEGHRISKLANRIDSFTRMSAFLEEHLGC